MRRFTISAAAAVIVLLSGAPLGAQVTVGLWSGLNVASMVRTPAKGPPDRTGASFGRISRRALGLTIGVPITGGWGVQLNVGDSRKGGDISHPAAKAAWEHEYLEFSLLADVPLALGDGDRAWLHLLVGPALAYRRSCLVWNEYRGTRQSEDCADRERWKPYKDRDYGVVGGTEVELELSGRIGAVFGALYTFGLMDINDEPDWAYVEKNRVLTLRAGLQFSIG